MTDGREIEPLFTNTRLEAEENQTLMALARAGADAFGYTATLGLDRELAQLVRLRVAQINNCAYCLNPTIRLQRMSRWTPSRSACFRRGGRQRCAMRLSVRRWRTPRG